MLKKLFIIISLAIGVSCSGPKESVDIIIKNGQVLDGTGAPARSSDVIIKGDRVHFLGEADLSKYDAIKVIDAEGLVVSPGFIDPHTHALGDLTSVDRKSNLNYLTQGVTTVFVGNDGEGPFEIATKAEALTSNGIGTNVAFFVGHGKVRKAVLGDEDKAPTPAQMSEMKALVRQGMQEGAFGFSTGLYYAPGSFAETDEVIELSKEIAPFQGVYDSHIRDESSYNIGLIEAVKEALEIGRQAGVAVHLAHIKALGVDVWKKSDDIIALVQASHKEGMTVTADQYPWQASGTHIENALINRWVMEGGEEPYMNRLRDQKLLPKIKAEMKENLRKRGGPASILITADCRDTTLIGLNLKQISDQKGEDPIDVALQIALDGGARIASFNMNAYDVEQFMIQPWVMTSSDGTKGHPRKYASFPKKYEKYVLDRKIISTEAFVHKSSALVAQTFGIEKRGEIKQGNYADIIVWDPKKYRAQADFANPERLSPGMQFVIVNGKVTISEGQYTEQLSGLVLRKSTQ